MSALGLDLGRHSFRAVELDRKKDNLILLNYGAYSNPKIDIESSSPRELDLYSEALKHFFREIKFEGREVIVSLPESEVFTRVISVPQMSEKDLKSSVGFEVSQYLPISIDDVKYDVQIIDPDLLKNENNKMNVLLVAAKKTVLDKYVKLIKKADLIPIGLEPQTLAVQRALGDSRYNSNASIIVDIGTLSTQLIVTYRGYVRFTRVLSTGGYTLTKALMQGLDLEENQAEQYKKAYGLDEDQVEGKVYKVLKPVFDNILLEIKRSKIFYTTHNPDVKITKVILSGGTALMPGILFYLASNLDAEVELANPWRDINLPKKLENHKDLIMDHGPIYVGAVGLALKEMTKK
jgi:type IV pilus assembly protein PilM